MNNQPQMTPANIRNVFIIAVIADALQLPLTLGMIFGVTAPVFEIIIIGVDITTMILVSRLIGFHWLLLPCFIAETIPGLDLIPSWTASVALMIKLNAPPKPAIQMAGNGHDAQLRNANPTFIHQPPPLPNTRSAKSVVETEFVDVTPRYAPPPLPPQYDQDRPKVENDLSFESRLERLSRLHRLGQMTDSELKTMREKILNQL